jgi:RNA polymerase sigma factor (TIGR02999 family)
MARSFAWWGVSGSIGIACDVWVAASAGIIAIMTDVTRILAALERGEPHTARQLLPLVYDELRRLAARNLAEEKPGQTLQATALVHEAYLRLVGHSDEPRWDNRGHFFAAAAEAMRRILVENVRRKRSLKRGGGRERAELADAQLTAPEPAEDLLALDEALDRLATKDPVKAELVKLRYFVGMTIEEAAEVLRISPATAKRYWTYSRTWLHQQIASDADEPPLAPA